MAYPKQGVKQLFSMEIHVGYRKFKCFDRRFRQFLVVRLELACSTKESHYGFKSKDARSEM
jgi:hypothetical protein